MATVFIEKMTGKTKSSYAVRFKDPLSGKNKYYKSYRLKKEAQQAANDLRALIDTGKIADIQRSKAKLNFLTFAQVGDLLKDAWQDRLELGELRAPTFEGYCYLLGSLKKTFGKKLLSEISKADLSKYQKEVFTELSSAASNRRMFIIKQVFKHGLTIKAALTDPTADIKYLSEKAHERNVFLLPERINQLIEVSQQTRAKFYMPALIYLGAEHGASKQEALSLTWDDINFDYDGEGTIHFFRTKNGHERTEYLMPRSKKALLVWRDHLESKRRKKGITTLESNHVFCRIINGEPIKCFDNAWRSVCRLAKISDLHFHDLRHTFCSNLLLTGADLKLVKDMIGHSDIAMTDRYSHLTLNYKRAFQHKLAAHYANA